MQFFCKGSCAIRKEGGALPIGAVKVVSDIDDTLFSSGGRWPAGIDRVYPPRVSLWGLNADFVVMACMIERKSVVCIFF